MTSRDKPPAGNTPIIIAAAQHVERLPDNEAPRYSSPMTLAGIASLEALRDAGIPPREIDTVAAIRLFADTARAWASPFGGSSNPPESVAKRIGASPARRIYSSAGGTQPLQIMLELMQAIARGESRMALLTGAEALASQRHALRHGVTIDWREEHAAPLDDRSYSRRYASKMEIGSGLSLPMHYYALIENAQAHGAGRDLQEHRRHMARILAPFSVAAAANPFAQSTRLYTAAQLATEDADNYAISPPYTRRLVAQDAVNQSAALLLTSVGEARRLGVDSRQWIYLESFAAGEDTLLSLRENPARSLAMERVLRAALDRVNARGGEMDLIDIYSCFPCAVQAACDALSLSTDGTPPLTVTGGLPFFGGPGNNYSLHALAEVARRLRGTPSRALVTANGGFLSAHAAALLSSEALRARGIDWVGGEDLTVNCADIPARQEAPNPDIGTVISWTVIARREKADIGIVLAETASGERFLASSVEPAVTAALRDRCPIGRAVTVETLEPRPVFSFRAD